MTKEQVKKEQRNILIKIALLIPPLVAAIILLHSMEVKAAVYSVPSTLGEVSGPSKSFLVEWPEEERYVLIDEEGDCIGSWIIYASGILDDGTVVYAAERGVFVAILPSGLLIQGKWGEGVAPVRVIKNYTFKLY